MKLKQVVAGAAIGCTLSMTGISLGSGVANAAPPCGPPGAQCGGPGGPGGPPPQRGPGGPGGPGGDFRGPGGPAVPVVRPATSADPAVQAVRPATSADPAAQAVPAISADPAGPTSAGPTTMTSADPTTTIGDHRGTQGITTGAVGSTVPRGVTGRRRGAGVHRRRLCGTDRYRKHGGRRRRRSTTGASTSNRCGIPATTNGVSTSSGSGFRFRSDLPTGRPPRMHWGWPSSQSWGQFT